MTFFKQIWGRYFLVETLKVALLFLVCFYGLYMMIDYTNHSTAHHASQQKMQWLSFAEYYACEFILRSEVLIPFALLLGTIKTLCKLNTNNELIAMMAGGIPIHTLLKPYLFVGLAFTGLMYLNNEFVVPVVAKERKYFDDLRASRKNANGHGAQHLLLADQTILIYHHYDSVKEQFVDVYWLRSTDDFFRMEALQPHSKPPLGLIVDHIVRESPEKRSLQASYSERQFPEISFQQKTLADTVIPPEGMPLTELWEVLPSAKDTHTEKDARLMATFHRKLALPWLCLLAVIAPIPWCIRFSRNFPAALIYAGGVFGLVATYILMDASHVLARRQLLDPLWAIWGPLGILLITFGWRYWRIR